MAMAVSILALGPWVVKEERNSPIGCCTVKAECSIRIESKHALPGPCRH
jgi:hypothetical protein